MLDTATKTNIVASLNRLIIAASTPSETATTWAEGRGGVESLETYEYSLQSFSSALNSIMPELERRVGDLANAIMKIGFYAGHLEKFTRSYQSFFQGGLLSQSEALEDLETLADIPDDTDDTAVYTYIQGQLLELKDAAQYAKDEVSKPGSDAQTVGNTVKPLFRILLNMTTIMEQRSFDDEY